MRASGFEPEIYGVETRCPIHWAMLPWQEYKDLNPDSLVRSQVLYPLSYTPMVATSGLEPMSRGYQPRALAS